MKQASVQLVLIASRVPNPMNGQSSASINCIFLEPTIKFKILAEETYAQKDIPKIRCLFVIYLLITSGR